MDRKANLRIASFHFLQRCRSLQKLRLALLFLLSCISIASYQRLSIEQRVYNFLKNECIMLAICVNQQNQRLKIACCLDLFPSLTALSHPLEKSSRKMNRLLNDKTLRIQNQIMKIHTLSMTILSLAAALGFSSCTSSPSGLAGYQAYDVPTKLPKNPSAVKVKVSLSKQRVYVMEGNELLLAMPVSVGKSATPTPKGNFRIYNKEARRRANTHGYVKIGGQVRPAYLKDKPSGAVFRGTPMAYWCEFKPAYGFHTGWLKHEPCTHGCIRMHENLAPKFFKLVSNGTSVNISNSQLEDAQWSEMPIPPDATNLPDYPMVEGYWDGGRFTQHKTPQYQ